MAVEHLGWINIDECVNTYLDRSEQSVHKYYKCRQLAFDGMQQMGLDFFYQIKTQKLPLLSNNTVALPDDYLQYCKVGILNSIGEIIPFRYNPTLTTYSDLQLTRRADTETFGLYDNYQWQGSVFFNYWDGSGVTNLYGAPSGSPYVGTFRIDADNGVILLGESYTFPYMVMEYVASPEEGGDYYVPTQFKEALIAFIGYQDILFMPNSRKSGLGDKEQRKRHYYNERRLANARFKPFYLDQAYIDSQRSQRLTVKG